MKTHSARWVQNGPHSWILKETFANGSAVMGTIRRRTIGINIIVFDFDAARHVGTADSFRSAQRAVRRALKEASDGA